ncbi:MAG: universal stress protein [Pseudomonadota bacterium]
MKSYARDRCTNPRSYYHTAQDVLNDDDLSDSEKELALKTMAAQVELLDNVGDDDTPTVGDHPPTIHAIHAALSELGEPHGFSEGDNTRTSKRAGVEHVVAAISGNSEVDTEVCKVAKKVFDITKAHVHFVSVITHVTDPAEYGALGPVSATTVAPHVGIRRLEDEKDERKREFAEFARHCALPDGYSSEVRTGLIDDEVIKAADEGDASLIIVGSGKKTGLDGVLSSDVAREVSSKANRPVLVVPEKVGEKT